MNLEEKLFQYYLDLKSPEAGVWNTSPACIHTEMVTRDYMRKNFIVTPGLQVCNVGIGTGDWDDFLGYWLKDKGVLTSIDLDKDICEIFTYRQQREGHPNPASVIGKSILDTALPKEKFEIVTMIGSAINEIGEFERTLEACFQLLKKGGHFMFMANSKYSPVARIEEYIENTDRLIEQKDFYDAFPEYPFYILKVMK